MHPLGVCSINVRGGWAPTALWGGRWAGLVDFCFCCRFLPARGHSWHPVLLHACKLKPCLDDTLQAGCTQAVGGGTQASLGAPSGLFSRTRQEGSMG